MPRWSVAGTARAASIAGLPASRACVRVGPPLSARAGATTHSATRRLSAASALHDGPGEPVELVAAARCSSRVGTGARCHRSCRRRSGDEHVPRGGQRAGVVELLEERAAVLVRRRRRHRVADERHVLQRHRLRRVDPAASIGAVAAHGGVRRASRRRPPTAMPPPRPFADVTGASLPATVVRSSTACRRSRSAAASRRRCRRPRCPSSGASLSLFTSMPPPGSSSRPPVMRTRLSWSGMFVPTLRRGPADRVR